MLNHPLQSTVFSMTLLAAGAAVAQDTAPGPIWAHFGPAYVDFKNGGDVTAGGATVPGASTKASNNLTVGVELGYDLSPQFSARFTVGFPPTTKVEGTGNLSSSAGVPQPLAKVTYGPAVLSATWHPLGRPQFSPYVGVGLNYPIIFKSKDAYLVNVDAKSKVGPVVELGADCALDARWGVFVDVKKLWTKVDVTAELPGGGPAAATTANLSPIVLHAGVSYRF